MPERVIEKPPSAELRADQRDEDSLPPYAVLDGILERLIEGDQSVAEVVAAGFERETVQKVERLIYLVGVQAVPVGAGGAADQQGLLARPAVSDREPLAGPDLTRRLARSRYSVVRAMVNGAFLDAHIMHNPCTRRMPGRARGPEG